MPGFLGGSTGGSGTGGEITFPKEFIDPVTKLRISQPENLIDTDFEYGLQPTKWETVELINNTPSFFSKSGDTTIDGIVSITTNNGTREITVLTALEHGLAVGIPISVTGTKSVTADGSYIINSIPNTTTFTYLCKDEQEGDNSIEDLYTSIITGEFFQGSQIRVANTEGVTTDGEAQSTLTVKTESTHGFGVNTPFYFLNLNSTISQEFEAANTAAKSFDSSNSATAQTFDGSNTLSTINIDWSNSATIGGTVSNVTGQNTVNNTITVSHTTETFANQPVGTPLYYNVSTSSGYFFTNPRGVVFLKTTNALNTPALQSTFQVSATPDGPAIAILASVTGTFQLANQARTFAGNNVDGLTQISIPVIRDAALPFEGANDGGPLVDSIYTNGNPLSTLANYSGSLVNVTVTAGAGLVYYTGAMVRYNTTGSAASGLVNNASYFVDSFFSTGTNTFAFTLKELPTSATAITISGGSGTQTFRRVGLSLDKNIIHIRNSSYTEGDLLEYSYPVDGAFTSDSPKTFFFVSEVYDSHNYQLSDALFNPTTATGGTISTTSLFGRTYNVHTFTAVGQSTFTVTDVGSDDRVIVHAYGAGGGAGHTGGWGAGSNGGGGGYASAYVEVTAKAYKIMVGGAGAAPGNSLNGVASTSFTAGGGGPSKPDSGDNRYNGQGGGLSGFFDNDTYNVANAILIAGGGGGGGSSRAGEGNVGGAGGGTTGQDGTAAYDGQTARRGRGGGQTGPTALPTEGNSTIPGQLTGGVAVNYGGGGGGGWWGGSAGTYTESNTMGGGGGGSGYAHPTKTTNAVLTAGSGRNPFGGSYRTTQGVGASPNSNNATNGIVSVLYPITPFSPLPAVATGGTTGTYTSGGITYKTHTFTSVGTTNFVVTEPGNLGSYDYLIVAGGGSGGSYVGGGGGGGGVISGTIVPSATTYPIVVGNGAAAVGSTTASLVIQGLRGGNSSAFGQTAIGGGGGGTYAEGAGLSGGSGGGAGGFQNSTGGGGAGTAGQGFAGGNTQGGRPRSFTGGGGGGGAAGTGETSSNGLNRGGDGGAGVASAILGTNFFFGGGGGGGNYTDGARPGNGGIGGGGGGSSNTANVSGIGGGSTWTAVAGGNGSPNGDPNNNGGAGAPNTGGGGGGIGHHGLSGPGGSGVVIIRYPISIPE
jgi:hypothetical protein